MTNKNIEYFLAVARELNISKAANSLFISQQALSNTIRRMETDYGVALFDRNPALSLTQAGEYMVYYCQQVMLLDKWLQKNLNDISHNVQQTINLGISSIRSPFFLPEILNRCKEELPNVMIRQNNCIIYTYEELLNHGAIDFYLGTVPSIEKKSDNQEIILLGQEELYCVFHEDLLKEHYPDNWEQILSSLNQNFEIQLLDKLPFILLDNKTFLTNLIQQYLLNHNFSPFIILESENLPFIYNLCQEGYGAAIVSSLVMNPYGQKQNKVSDKFHAYKLSSPDMNLPIILAYETQKPLLKHEEIFVDIIKSIFLHES